MYLYFVLTYIVVGYYWTHCMYHEYMSQIYTLVYHMSVLDNPYYKYTKTSLNLCYILHHSYKETLKPKQDLLL